MNATPSPDDIRRASGGLEAAWTVRSTREVLDDDLVLVLSGSRGPVGRNPQNPFLP
jgi:hypothetical protein